MDFDVNVSKVQGTLYSLGSQGLLNNSGSLQNMVEAMKEIVHDLPDSTKSKITFLMVLNTQLSVSEDLCNDDFVCLFTNTLPPIEKEYLVIYSYHLSLQSHLFKVIENCPGALGLELLDVIIKKLKDPTFHRDEFGIEHLYQLWKSVFVKICKINSGLHANDSVRPFMAYFQEVYDLIQNVIITCMKVCGLESFVGFHLYYFFKNILYFVQHKNLDLADDSIYQLSVEFNSGDPKEDDVTVDYIKVCNNLIFEKMFKVLKNLTLDMWMTFSECFFDTDSKNSVQLLIGYSVWSILDEVKDIKLPSDVLNCLSSLAINKADLMTKTILDEVITNVKNEEKEWFSALVFHSDFIKKNSLECLHDHLHLANSDDLDSILKKSYEYLSSCKSDENLDLVKKLFLKALKTTSDPIYWLEKVFETYQPDFLTTAGTHDEIVETFNKISREKNVPNCDIITLCMQSPFETIKRICQMAVCGSHQTNFIIDILKLLKHACNASPSEGLTLLDYVLLKFVLNNLTDAEKQPFINLVTELGKENLLTHSFFNNLLKTLKEYLENDMLEKAVICLETTKPLLCLKLCEIDVAAFLVFMSQVLGFFSWDLKSFSVVKAEGRDSAGHIVNLIISRLGETNEPEFKWVREEILKTLEINQAYFCDLWFAYGQMWPGSGKIHSCILGLVHSRYKTDHLRNFLMNFNETFEVMTSIVTALSVLLPVSTFLEWNSIFNNLMIVSGNLSSRKSDVDVNSDVLDMFGSALFVLALKLKTDKKVFPCYQHCLRNFGRLTALCCPKMSGGSILYIFKKIFFILDTVEYENERKSCWKICLPVMLELIDWMKKKKIAEDDRNVIKALLPLLDLKDVTEVICKNL